MDLRAVGTIMGRWQRSDYVSWGGRS